MFFLYMIKKQAEDCTGRQNLTFIQISCKATGIRNLIVLFAFVLAYAYLYDKKENFFILHSIFLIYFLYLCSGQLSFRLPSSWESFLAIVRWILFC